MCAADSIRSRAKGTLKMATGLMVWAEPEMARAELNFEMVSEDLMIWVEEDDHVELLCSSGKIRELYLSRADVLRLVAQYDLTHEYREYEEEEPDA